MKQQEIRCSDCKEHFIVYCDMRESSIKNFSYKYIKYVDAIVMKALPYRLKTAFFILGKSSNYAILYQAFYKIFFHLRRSLKDLLPIYFFSIS